MLGDAMPPAEGPSSSQTVLHLDLDLLGMPSPLPAKVQAPASSSSLAGPPSAQAACSASPEGTVLARASAASDNSADLLGSDWPSPNTAAVAPPTTAAAVPASAGQDLLSGLWSPQAGHPSTGQAALEPAQQQQQQQGGWQQESQADAPASHGFADIAHSMQQRLDALTQRLRRHETEEKGTGNRLRWALGCLAIACDSELLPAELLCCTQSRGRHKQQF